MNGEHYRSVRHLGVADVETADFMRVETTLSEITEFGGMMAVTGEVGLGKSFAVLSGVREVCQQLGLPWYWVESGVTPSVLKVTKKVAKQMGLTIRHHDDVTDIVIDALSLQPCVVVVDEIQTLTLNGLAQMRTLHEGTDGATTLVLVGAGSKASERLDSSKEITSRLEGHINFTRLDEQAMVSALKEYHPQLKAQNVTLLQSIDRVYGNGNFREWVKLFGRAMKHGREAGHGGALQRNDLKMALNGFGVDPKDVGLR